MVTLYMECFEIKVKIFCISCSLGARVQSVLRISIGGLLAELRKSTLVKADQVQFLLPLSWSQ